MSSSAIDQADFASALLDPSLACPAGLRAWNGSDPSARLAVHRNNVVSSLIDALADGFPVVQELVGIEFFRAMAALFVRRAPPRSRVLADYGHDLASFIAQFAPARSVPYLADMARLERARVRSYHAADAAMVTRESFGIAMDCGDRVGDLLLVLHPSVSIVRSPYAVVSIWSAHQDNDQNNGKLGSIDIGRPEDAVILRTGLDVLVLNATPGSAEFIAALLDGSCLGDAGGAATASVTGFDLSAALALLVRHGALTSIRLPESGPA